ncbi:MAG: sugar phosphate nucleotidyltransferase [Terriglobales bacterium]
MLGIIPAAGLGSRLQPLGCSKELLPVGRSHDGGAPKAVIEFLLERMLLAGADRICIVISGEKTDIVRYLARSTWPAFLFFVAQPQPRGLCDAVFRAMPWVRADEPVLMGLPDTVWFPGDAFCRVPDETLHLITFPVDRPDQFDAVRCTCPGIVERVEVKCDGAPGRRVWGAITGPGVTWLRLHQLWLARASRDIFLGHLLNAWLERGELLSADETGEEYLDVGTLRGYQKAQWRLEAWQPTVDSAS